jgi:hypothetical protein
VESEQLLYPGSRRLRHMYPLRIVLYPVPQSLKAEEVPLVIPADPAALCDQPELLAHLQLLSVGPLSAQSLRLQYQADSRVDGLMYLQYRIV